MSDSCSPLLSQAISISKAINTQEAPVKEKHARRILSLGSPGQRGADPVPRLEGFHRARFGREETPQSLVGRWHHVGLSISKNANEHCNKLAFLWQ